MSNVTPFPGQVDRDALALNFFEKILPASGLYCAAVQKRGGLHQTFHESLESLWTILRDADRSGYTAYFALASFASNQDRTAENVFELQCLWLDIDYGKQGHASAGYATEAEAALALKDFCIAVGLPAPMVVKSGGGLHVYWAMKTPLTRAKWLPYAEGLKAACMEHGLRAEPAATANAAMILRPPSTTNRKLGVARPVELGLEWLANGPYDWPDVLLGFKRSNVIRLIGRLPPRPEWLGAYVPSESFPNRYELVSAASLVSECGQYARFKSGEALPYPLWLLLLAGLRHTENGEQLAHEWSEKDTRYKRSQTQILYDGAQKLSGPPRCDSIKNCADEKTRAVCLACPKEGTVVTPFFLRTPEEEPTEPTPQQPKKAAFVEWDKTDKGLIKSGSYKNASIAIGRLEIECRHDTFHLVKIVKGEGVGPELDDGACRAVREKIITRFRFDPGKINVQDALERECERNPFDPIADYLKSLTWDGHARLNHWLTEHLGAEDTPLNRAFGRKILLAAVRRVSEPGCKFDYLLVLEGPQGAGKSSAWRILAGAENFSDQPIKWDDPKQQREAAGGVWIHEIAELIGLRKADVEAIKSFLSRQNDRTRAAYDRYPSDQHRQCLFVGTVNPAGRFAEYLTDPTGARRFWPVKVGRINLVSLARERDQIWAEAFYHESRGESLELDPKLYQAAADQQDLRRVADPWCDILSQVSGAVVSSIDLMVRDLALDRGRINPHDSARVGACMRRLGWDGPKQVQIEGRWMKGYTR